MAQGQPSIRGGNRRTTSRLPPYPPASETMDALFVPAERLRHIEAEGLFGTWEWDFATGAITWSDGATDRGSRARTPVGSAVLQSLP